MNNFMKYFLTFAAFFSFASTLLHANQNDNNQEKATIFCDLDDVLIQKNNASMYIRYALHGFSLNPSTTINYLKSLWAIKNRKKDDGHGGLWFYKGEETNGLTFNFLCHGMKDPRIAPYVAGLVKLTEQNRSLISVTEKTLRYLKTKGHPIIIATNKDRVSYDYAAEYHGSRLTDLANKVIVTDKQSNPIPFLKDMRAFVNGPTPPYEYKELWKKALETWPTDTIFHAPSKKPEQPYYEYMLQKAGKECKNVLFIDDKQGNIEGFEALQNKIDKRVYGDKQLYGIRFDSKKPLHLVDTLIEYGVLSEVNDAAFLQDVRYSNLSIPAKCVHNMYALADKIRKTYAAHFA